MLEEPLAPKGSGSLDPMPALRRAAERARRVALQTNTPLVLVRDGKIIHVMPDGSVVEKL